MEATVSNFHYGAVTPVAAFLMACLGAALGLRCTTRAIRRGTNRAGWLALGAVSIGCGIWTMHFIAMAGFTIDGMSMKYDSATTVLSLVVAIAVVAVGVFLVGFRGPGTLVLTTAGVFTGLGVAAMHYLGMAAMHTPGELNYSYGTVALSILIAVVAATAALWAAVSVHGLGASVGASLIMGVAVTGMHYTGMAAVAVPVDHHGAGTQSSAGMLSFLLVMLAGPLAALVMSAVVVMFDGDVMLGADERGARTSGPAPAPGHAVAGRGGSGSYHGPGA
ncbi:MULTISPECIES: MHYT domain-containing protein [unclassified Streptomyces]|uniref:MHYT domain-containing protein n=1 Tax=unclassified Streptomyces TaxID=2593676 RepID=UPI00081F171F|nr:MULTISPECIES: MHYT domain-containing protein [unclassified Streptomyces]SCD59624.1 MHYT domain-containing protein, NO-binding membrane sensor [Streptomyces sp. ScaeMP-e83]